MSWFIVRFMKDVLGENGRQCEVCQSVVEVEAANENSGCRDRQAEILSDATVA